MGPLGSRTPCYDGLVTDDLTREAADLAGDGRRLLLDLDRSVPHAAATTGECRPPLDVLETSDAIEVVVDVPGIPPTSLRVAVRRSTVLIVGAKVPPTRLPGSQFHMAERAYGRFARAVRLSGALDPTRATAVVAAGQLRIILPRIEERRGQTIDVPVRHA